MLKTIHLVVSLAVLQACSHGLLSNVDLLIILALYLHKFFQALYCLRPIDQLYAVLHLTFISICRQIVDAEGPSGPNRDYLFNLETTLLQMGKDSEIHF